MELSIKMQSNGKEKQARYCFVTGVNKNIPRMIFIDATKNREKGIRVEIRAGFRSARTVDWSKCGGSFSAPPAGCLLLVPTNAKKGIMLPGKNHTAGTRQRTVRAGVKCGKTIPG